MMLLRMLMMMKYTYAMHPSLHYYSPFLDLRVLGWSLREGRRRRRRRRQTYTHTYLSVRRNKKPREHIGEGEREGKRERGREGERERGREGERGGRIGCSRTYEVWTL